MSTKIEKALYGNHGTHGVFEFNLSSDRITITVAPWVNSEAKVNAVFNHAKINYVSEYSDKHDPLDLPWDIIGFDSDEVESGKWRFILHCACIEWGFEADWPVITHT